MGDVKPSYAHRPSSDRGLEDGDKAATMGEMSSRIARRDFAKRFERGELSSRRPDVRTRTARTTGLLQLRVLYFSFFEDGDIGVGAFPEGVEIPVGGAAGRDVSLEDAVRAGAGSGVGS
jgi:hypothetical protein